jgi:Na+-driven multidrug efflux pump
MCTALAGAFAAGVIMSLATVTTVFAFMEMLGLESAVTAAVQCYVCIRAFGNPLFMMSNIAEGCCVGLRDSMSPLKVRGGLKSITLCVFVTCRFLIS